MERPSAAGAFPDTTAMVGDGMDGKLIEIIRETGSGTKTEFMLIKSRRAAADGVRASVVAKKRVTIVERRDAGKWMRNEPAQRSQTDDSGGNASTSRRSTRPMVVGGTKCLDRAHVVTTQFN